MLLQALRKVNKLTLQLFQPFSSHNLRLKHVSDMAVMHERRKYLNKVLLPKHKLIMNAEKRPLNSTIVGLKKQGKCAAVIQGRSGYPQLDIVLDGKTFKKLNRNKILKNRLIHVRLDGEEILCSINKIDIFEQRFVSKVFLNRFIEGQPNQVEVIVEPTQSTTNPHLKAGQQVLTYPSVRIKIITYNSDYPPILTYSVANVSPFRAYKMADLANTLPPGIFLHPLTNLDRKLFDIAMPDEKDDDEDDMAKIERMKEMDKAQSKQKKDEKKAAGGQAAGGAPGGGEKKEG